MSNESNLGLSDYSKFELYIFFLQMRRFLGFHLSLIELQFLQSSAYLEYCLSLTLSMAILTFTSSLKMKSVICSFRVR